MRTVLTYLKRYRVEMNIRYESVISSYAINFSKFDHSYEFYVSESEFDNMSLACTSFILDKLIEFAKICDDISLK